MEQEYRELLLKSEKLLVQTERYLNEVEQYVRLLETENEYLKAENQNCQQRLSMITNSLPGKLILYLRRQFAKMSKPKQK